MVSLCALLTFFIYMSLRDAKSTKPASSRIYPSSILEISEAASGSYVLHSCIFFSMLLLVLFLIVPPAPHQQVTSIEFVPPQVETRKIIHSERRSEKASEDSGRKDPTKQVAPSARGAQQSHQREQAKPQVKTTKQAAPEKPVEPTVNRSEASPLKSPQPIKPQTSTSAPPPPVPVSTPKPPVPQPNIHSQPPTAAAPMPLSASTAPPAIPHPEARMPVAASSSSHLHNAPPLPLIASATLPASQVGPLPALSNSGATGQQPAPRAVSHSAGGSDPGAVAAPPVRTATGTGNDHGSVPAPIAGNQHGSRSASDNNGAPVPKSVPTGGGNPSAARILFPTPVGNGTSDSGTGTPATSGKQGPDTVRTAPEPDWGPYMADLQRRIKRAWIPPKYHESNRVVVIFKIHKSGELSHLRLVTSSGSAIVDQAAMRAVEAAAPFRSLPVGADDDVDVQFTFDYNLFNGGGGHVRF
jgi:TonB family protein